jgi:segregation and condensation protein B
MILDEVSKKIINVLFASGEGLDILSIAKIISEESSLVNEKIVGVKKSLNEIGLELIVSGNNNGSMLSIVTHPDYNLVLHDYFKTQIEEDLTPAQLQALTIVAYLKEVSVQEISFIRGVQSSQSVRALSTRGLVKKIGAKYALTTEAFKILGVSNNNDLKDFEKINLSLTSKLSDTLNG